MTDDYDSDDNRVPEAYERDAPHFDDTRPEELLEFLEHFERMMEIDKTPAGEKNEFLVRKELIQNYPCAWEESRGSKLLVPPARLSHREAIQGLLSKLELEFEDKVKEYLIAPQGKLQITLRPGWIIRPEPSQIELYIDIGALPAHEYEKMLPSRPVMYLVLQEQQQSKNLKCASEVSG
ncbi:hypothetical protein C8F04DRAFT_1199661 [Mycena alexandri]|uniref:Uncharacterized protein n=1 Tax=Mycena alexandri TaxID=1745969 RepID=A0AAD6S312_9AGAR|nr:hypothetical protein C8F04DRAFT_1199661 [Mycena alexandri]